jgi:2'-5' RNA ligase
VSLDDATRSAVARVAARLQAQGVRGRFVPAENYHVTVAFLGSVPEDRLHAIVAAVGRAAPRIAPLRLALDTFGAFPNLRRPRVAWVGCGKRDPAFAAVCAGVRDALVPLGFSFEAHDDAHVTIVRCEPGTAALGSEPVEARSLSVGSVTLFSSVTGREGARYAALAVVPLGGEPPT